MMKNIPPDAMILLVGASGSGKSTFATRHFGKGSIVSSDECRELVCGDMTRQDVNVEAFRLRDWIVDTRLAAGVLTVIDSTNLRRKDREALRTLAKKHHRPVMEIALSAPLEILKRNNATRSRHVPEHIIDRHHQSMLSYLAELEDTTLHFQWPYNNVRFEIRGDPKVITVAGEVVVIGDVHGCYDELKTLLRGVPEEATIVYVGDFTDRGPKPKEVLNLVEAQILRGKAYASRGNHDWKLYRAKVLNREVRAIHGLAETLTKVEANDVDFLGHLPHQLTLRSEKYPRLLCTVAHGGIPFQDVGVENNKRVEAHCLYGETDGTKNDEGFPTRTYAWTDTWNNPDHMCVYGHTPVREVEYMKNTVNIDTGCAFGGKLTAYYPFTGQIKQVAAARAYANKEHW